MGTDNNFSNNQLGQEGVSTTITIIGKDLQGHQLYSTSVTGEEGHTTSVPVQTNTTYKVVSITENGKPITVEELPTLFKPIDLDIEITYDKKDYKDNLNIFRSPIIKDGKVLGCFNSSTEEFINLVHVIDDNEYKLIDGTEGFVGFDTTEKWINPSEGYHFLKIKYPTLDIVRYRNLFLHHVIVNEPVTNYIDDKLKVFVSSKLYEFSQKIRVTKEDMKFTLANLSVSKVNSLNTVISYFIQETDLVHINACKLVSLALVEDILKGRPKDNSDVFLIKDKLVNKNEVEIDDAQEVVMETDSGWEMSMTVFQARILRRVYRILGNYSISSEELEDVIEVLGKLNLHVEDMSGIVREVMEDSKPSIMAFNYDTYKEFFDNNYLYIKPTKVIKVEELKTITEISLRNNSMPNIPVSIYFYTKDDYIYVVNLNKVMVLSNTKELSKVLIYMFNYVPNLQTVAALDTDSYMTVIAEMARRRFTQIQKDKIVNLDVILRKVYKEFTFYQHVILLKDSNINIKDLCSPYNKLDVIGL